MSTDVEQSAYDLAVLPTLLFPDKDDSWRDQAACLGAPMSTFFNGRIAHKAKAICAICPNTGIDGPCLQFALRNHLVGGVFGGFTEDEREALSWP